MRTEYIERWFPNDPLYRLVVGASVGDPDGIADVARVVLTIPDFGFEGALAPAPGGDPGAYEGFFEEEALPAPLTELAGRVVRVEATDALGATGVAQGVQVVRVIAVAPGTVAPTGRETVATTTPTLQWNPVGLSFAFTYRVQLNRAEPIALHHAADALIAEAWVTGTHRGRIEGIDPTGKGFRFRMAAFFIFDGDRLTCVRNYFDHATIARQLA